MIEVTNYCHATTAKSKYNTRFKLVIIYGHDRDLQILGRGYGHHSHLRSLP